MTGNLFPPALLTEIRDQFYACDVDSEGGKRIFLDAAAGGLKLKAMALPYLRDSMIPGQIITDCDPASRRIANLFKEGEQAQRIFFNAPTGTIWPELTASSMICRLIFILAEYVPGTNIVTTWLEHPSVFDTMGQVSRKFHKELRTALPDAATGRIKTEDVVKLVDGNTAFLAIGHASNATGTYTDVAAIIEQARKIKPDLYVLVDGVQYAPSGPMDIQAWEPDAYVIAPYKFSCARGFGLSYLSERMALLPHIRLDGFVDSQWLIGSKNQAQYTAFMIMMDYLYWLGGHFTESKDKRDLTVAAMTAIKEHLLALFHLAMEGDEETPGLLHIPGVTTYGTGDETERNFTILFTIDGYDAGKLVELYCQNGVHLRARYLDAFSQNALKGLNVETPVLRASAGHYISPTEIKEFLRLTKKLAEKQ